MQFLFEAVYNRQPRGPMQRDCQEPRHGKPQKMVQDVELCGGDPELGCDLTPLSLFGLKDQESSPLCHIELAHRAAG